MIKFHITIDDSTIDNEIIIIDILQTSKIGSLIKTLCDKLQNKSIDIFNSKIYYNSIELDHSKCIDSYNDFQYKMKEFYELTFIPSYNKKKNNDINTNNIKSEPVAISISLPHEHYINKQLNKLSLSYNDCNLSVEQRLTNIELKINYIIDLLKNK